MHKALEIALEMKSDEIVGLLFEHLNVLDEKRQGLVSLSGMKLETVNPAWVLPSLGEKHTPRKRGRHKRNRSLGHMRELINIRRKSVGCIGDKSLEVLRNSTAGERTGNAGFDEPDGEKPNMLVSGNVRSLSPQRPTKLLGLRRHSAIEPILSQHSTLLQHASSLVDTSPTESSEGEYNPVSTPKQRRSGLNANPLYASSFQPRLSPIHGTPTSTLQRNTNLESMRDQDSIDYGVANINMNLEAVSTPRDNLSLDLSAVDLSHNSSRHTPRSRRQQDKGIVTGARRLPFSSVDEYSQQRRLSTESLDREESSESKKHKEFFISPNQLVHHFRKFRKRRKRRPSSYSSILSMRPESPVEIYPTKEYYDEIELQLLNGDMDRSSSTSANTSSAIFSPTTSLSTLEASRGCKTSSESSAVFITPASSRRSSWEASYSNTHCSSRDEVDFHISSYEAIPEEPITPSTPAVDLVKGLDLSSNELVSIHELVCGSAGEVVVQRLKGLQTLDLKQNKLSQLPSDLMQVSLY